MRWKFCSYNEVGCRHFTINTTFSKHGFLFDAVKGHGYHRLDEKCNRIKVPLDVILKIDRGEFLTEYAGMNLVEFLIRTFGPKPRK